MSRFDYDFDDEGIPYGLWEQAVSRGLGGARGQQALAALEEALLSLPEAKLVHGHLAAAGSVCAVGAVVAQKRAREEGADLATVIDAMAANCDCGHPRDAHRTGGGCTGTDWNGKPCWCGRYEPRAEDANETATAGMDAGLSLTMAYHLAFLNDEQFRDVDPETRFRRVLAWVRRAQGKTEDAPA
jgi:hypothetical protein